jgi:hypothetical protein
LAARAVTYSTVFIGFFLTCGCGDRQHLTGPTTGPVSVRGRIVDFSTQAAVAAAVVEFQTIALTSLTEPARATTDSTGAFVLTLPDAGPFVAVVDASPVGVAFISAPIYRGDFFVNGGDCVSRYGILADARTRKPIAGATVTVLARTAISGADGWYRVDLGCSGSTGFNTTFLYVVHPDYTPRQQGVGRGVQGVWRLDLDLERR